MKTFHSAYAPLHLRRGQLALPVKFSPLRESGLCNFFILNRDVSCKVYLRENPHFLSKISLKNLSPVSVCTPPRQAVSLPRVVTNYPSAAAQIAMMGQAKEVDFQKNCFYHTNLGLGYFKANMFLPPPKYYAFEKKIRDFQ